MMAIVRLLCGLVMALALAGCSSSPAHRAAPAVTRSTTATSTTSTALSPAEVHLTRAMPPAGIAIETADSIQILDLNGDEIGTLSHASLDPSAGQPQHSLRVHDAVDHYELSPGQVALTTAPPSALPPQFGCRDVASAGLTLTLC